MLENVSVVWYEKGYHDISHRNKSNIEIGHENNLIENRLDNRNKIIDIFSKSIDFFEWRRLLFCIEYHMMAPWFDTIME